MDIPRYDYPYGPPIPICTRWASAAIGGVFSAAVGALLHLQLGLPLEGIVLMFVLGATASCGAPDLGQKAFRRLRRPTTTEALITELRKARGQYVAALRKSKVNTLRTDGILTVGNADLAHSDFTGATLDGSAFNEVDLSRATLSEASLPGTVFLSVSFRGTHLQNVNAAKSRSNSVDFSGADLTRANYRGCWVRYGTFADATLTGACFSQAEIRDSDLSGVDFSDADLRGVMFERCDFRGADLSSAQLVGARFDWCDLRGARFGNVSLADTKLYGSHQIDAESLLGTRGLRRYRTDPTLWEELMPNDAPTRKLCEELLENWGGTLQEAIDHSHRAFPTDPDTHHLLLELLEDWDGTMREAIDTAELLRQA